MCAASPVVHTSNTSSCQKKNKLFRFSCDCEQFYEGRSFGLFVINVYNHREHYERLCIKQEMNYVAVVGLNDKKGEWIIPENW
jgi:hypothetical protein